jgi:actin-related protein
VAAKKKKKPTKVTFSNRQLNKACASYLQAHTEQLTASPIAGMVCDAAFRCDRDQQASLLGNVVLSGGGACIGPTDQAVPDLLREQVESIIHAHTPGWRVKMLSPGMQERAICSWLGGSILGSLGTFHDMWITKAEYEEWGSAIVNRKCP